LFVIVSIISAREDPFRIEAGALTSSQCHTGIWSRYMCYVFTKDL